MLYQMVKITLRKIKTAMMKIVTHPMMKAVSTARVIASLLKA
jgi:hypothetical protein